MGRQMDLRWDPECRGYSCFTTSKYLGSSAIAVVETKKEDKLLFMKLIFFTPALISQKGIEDCLNDQNMHKCWKMSYLWY